MPKCLFSEKSIFWTLFSLMSKLNMRRGMVCFQKMHDFLRLSFLAHCCNVTIATSFGIFFVQIIVPYHIVAKYAHFCLGSSFWKYAYFLFWSFLCNNCSLSFRIISAKYAKFCFGSFFGRFAMWWTNAAKIVCFQKIYYVCG